MPPVPVQVAVTVYVLSVVVLLLYGKLMATFCAFWQVPAELQNVMDAVPELVNVPPLAPVMAPVHCVALAAWKVADAELPLWELPVVCCAGVSGDAGPNETLPPLLPQPAPVEDVAVACRWPGVEPVVTGPVV